MTDETPWIPTEANLLSAQFPGEDLRSLHEIVTEREQFFGETDILLGSISECYTGTAAIADRIISDTRITRDGRLGEYRYVSRITSKTRHSEIRPDSLSCL